MGPRFRGDDMLMGYRKIDSLLSVAYCGVQLAAYLSA